MLASCSLCGGVARIETEMNHGELSSLHPHRIFSPTLVHKHTQRCGIIRSIRRSRRRKKKESLLRLKLTRLVVTREGRPYVLT